MRDTSNWQVGDETNKATVCTSAVFCNNERYDKFVYIPATQFLAQSRPPSNHLRKDFVGRHSFPDIIVPIEVKVCHDESAFEFHEPNSRTIREDTEGGRAALEHFEKFLASTFGHQHRTHIILLYVYCDQARMIYIDRDGCTISTPFWYRAGPSSMLHRFFWRLTQMSRERLGYDTTTRPATQEEFDSMLQFSVSSPHFTPYARDQLHYALRVDPPTVSNSDKIPPLTSAHWPLQRVLRDNGSHVLIGRPMFASPALFGRCTRVFVAFDPTQKEVCVMKDSWRVDNLDIRPEHKVYERLKSHQVEDYILTCLGGENVGEALAGSPQRTRVPTMLPEKEKRTTMTNHLAPDPLIVLSKPTLLLKTGRRGIRIPNPSFGIPASTTASSSRRSAVR